ncbi:MAG: hypothetical protein GY938_08875 [Ketobacter sp.]|nr:hypothetical protein [Ketobacter sp.]
MPSPAMTPVQAHTVVLTAVNLYADPFNPPVVEPLDVKVTSDVPSATNVSPPSATVVDVESTPPVIKVVAASVLIIWLFEVTEVVVMISNCIPTTGAGKVTVLPAAVSWSTKAPESAATKVLADPQAITSRCNPGATEPSVPLGAN